jgi:hypothetical protein
MEIRIQISNTDLNSTRLKTKYHTSKELGEDSELCDDCELWELCEESSSMESCDEDERQGTRKAGLIGATLTPFLFFLGGCSREGILGPA